MKRARRRAPDPVGLLLWLLPILVAVLMAMLAIWPVWDMDSWLR